MHTSNARITRCFTLVLDDAALHMKRCSAGGGAGTMWLLDDRGPPSRDGLSRHSVIVCVVYS